MKLSVKIILMCFLAASAISVIGCGRRAGLKTGEPAQDFRLDTLSNDRFYLHQHRGKVVVLVFWTTWCRYCRTEMAELQSLRQTVNNDDFVIAAVCMDPENTTELRRIVTDIGIRYPVLLDKGAEVASKYKVAAVPSIVIIDRQGNIGLVREGYSRSVSQQVRSKVTSLIEQGKGT